MTHDTELVDQQDFLDGANRHWWLPGPDGHGPLLRWDGRPVLADVADVTHARSASLQCAGIDTGVPTASIDGWLPAVVLATRYVANLGPGSAAELWRLDVWTPAFGWQVWAVPVSTGSDLTAGAPRLARVLLEQMRPGPPTPTPHPTPQ